MAAAVSSFVELRPNRASLEKTAGYMPNLEVEIIEGVHHVTAYRDPAFVAAIGSFIAKHATAPSDDSGE